MGGDEPMNQRSKETRAGAVVLAIGIFIGSMLVEQAFDVVLPSFIIYLLAGVAIGLLLHTIGYTSIRSSLLTGVAIGTGLAIGDVVRPMIFG